MKHSAILFTAMLLLGSNLFSQNTIDKILTAIEKNNTTLLALQKQVEAQKLGNKTGIFPNNPEFEFNYLVGNPSGIGNRTDISLKQSFDFPTVYAYKSQIANARNGQAEYEFQKERKSILLNARWVCIDLVYTNSLKVELEKRLANAQSIANAYKTKLNEGETNILEFNKSQLYFLDTKKEVEKNDIERNSLLSELASFNGGIAIEFNDNLMQTAVIPNDFEQWYLQVEQNNPFLGWLKQEIEISLKQTKLSKAMSLPKFSLGYMSERVVGQNFQGVSAGISIPLWENKNTVKQAKAQTLALQSIEADNKIKFYNQLKMQHAKAIALQKSAIDYRSSIELYNNAELLKKALDKGEIALIDYILELSVYYNSLTKVLEIEKELNKTIAELEQYIQN
ncbi:MAG: transporter [Bacteroidales bacterium]|nr:MAG: transporter [Bacteroidales bacterium]